MSAVTHIIHILYIIRDGEPA